MKLASLFLCIYLMLLSVMPCSDGQECASIAQTSIAASDDHNNHTHEAEMCTPFCICACCGSIVPMTQQSASLRLFDFGSKEITTSYNAFLPLEVYHPIWQPPKIS